MCVCVCVWGSAFPPSIEDNKQRTRFGRARLVARVDATLLLLDYFRFVSVTYYLAFLCLKESEEKTLMNSS